MKKAKVSWNELEQCTTLDDLSQCFGLTVKAGLLCSLRDKLSESESHWRISAQHRRSLLPHCVTRIIWKVGFQYTLVPPPAYPRFKV
jgi:hypothetical protein